MNHLPEHPNGLPFVPAAGSRRRFLGRTVGGLGGLAWSALGGNRAFGDETRKGSGAEVFPHFTPKAKRVIYLFQAGGPPQIDLFDYKPGLNGMHGKDIPDSVFKGNRFSGISSQAWKFPIAKSVFRFEQHGESGAWLSDLQPYLADVVDDIAFVKSMHTEAIDHDPALTFMQSGFQLEGRPGLGSWVSYGSGAENQNLPAFVTLLSGEGEKPHHRLWSPRFLPSRHRGIEFQSEESPVLFFRNPDDSSEELGRETVRDASLPEAEKLEWERAERMQQSVPELTDLSSEPESTFELYGEDARKPGTYAYNALMARRMVERGTQFVQLFHQGWDAHSQLLRQLGARCRETDKATAGLLKDLKLRGLLDETLVVWGGEFGRSVYCQGDLAPQNYGRDHHPGCFTTWMAGGGIRSGITYGKTDDFSYQVVENPVSVHDFHATILHLLGLDHEKLTFGHQGQDYRLTDVHGRVIEGLLA